MRPTFLRPWGRLALRTGGDGMPVYMDVLMVLNFLVDLLLLIGTNRLCGYPPGVKRAAFGAILGGIYGGACILPGFSFLAGTIWRMVSLGLIAGVAFGFKRESLRRGTVFVLLSMALGGVALGLGNGSFWTLVLSAVAVCLMCLLGLRGRVGTEFVPVEIVTEKKTVHITALRDTGNTLTDPLTGQPILVVSAELGWLVGLTPEELKDPVLAMEKGEGLRLVPYHAVGQPGGMLPAKRFQDVKIGSQKGSCLIAFAPNELGRGMPYEALTGGV